MEGTLIGLGLIGISGTPEQGALYVNAFVTDKDDVQKQPLFTGYCYPGHPLRGIGGFPLAPGDKIQINSWSSQTSLVIRPAITVVRDAFFVGGWEGTAQRMDEGQGRQITTIGTSPAAGAEFTHAVPTNAKQRLESVRLALTTDANAADRSVSLKMDDGTTYWFQTEGGPAHAASLTKSYVFARPYQANKTFDARTFAHDTLPDIILSEGYTWFTDTMNLQVGDDFITVSYVMREWLSE